MFELAPLIGLIFGAVLNKILGDINISVARLDCAMDSKKMD